MSEHRYGRSFYLLPVEEQEILRAERKRIEELLDARKQAKEVHISRRGGQSSA